MRIINIKKNPNELVELGQNLELLLPDSPVIAFCGGRSITKILEPLKKHIAQNFFSKFLTANYLMIDERMVPLDNNDSNYRLINNNFYKFLKECTKHPPEFLPFLSDQIESSLKKYSKIVDDNKGIVDLVFLGVGEDGHIAGLFPSAKWDEEANFFVFEDAPKPPPHRMTASPKLIRSAKTIILAFLGEEKRAAWNNFQERKLSPSACPCLLCADCENLFIITDLS